MTLTSSTAATIMQTSTYEGAFWVLLFFTVVVTVFVYYDAKQLVKNVSQMAEIWAILTFLGFFTYFWLGLIILIAYVTWRYQKFGSFVPFSSPTEQETDTRTANIALPFTAAADEETTAVEEFDSDVSDAMPISTATESPTGYITVTAEVVTCNPLEEDQGMRAILRDSSGVINLVSHDESFSEQLRELEGEYVVVKNAEVQEQDGIRQLVPVEALTEIEQIQAGAGHTVASASGSNS